MKSICLGMVIGIVGFATTALSADPMVSNVRASQRAGTHLVDITYDVTATGAVSVSLAVSTNAGLTYDLPATHFSGSGYGSGVTPGTNKAIVMNVMPILSCGLTDVL